MTKLQTRLTYIERCGYCKNDETYVMRDTNVNSSIDDDEAFRQALLYVGTNQSKWCEACKLITRHRRIAYDLPEEES
jgi:hypothetical protein